MTEMLNKINDSADGWASLVIQSQLVLSSQVTPSGTDQFSRGQIPLLHYKYLLVVQTSQVKLAERKN